MKERLSSRNVIGAESAPVVVGFHKFVGVAKFLQIRRFI